MEEPLNTSQDDGMDYGSLGSDSRLEGSCGGEGEDNASLMIPNKYEQSVATSQAQPLPEAVVEALAGPSGMQGVSPNPCSFIVFVRRQSRIWH